MKKEAKDGPFLKKEIMRRKKGEEGSKKMEKETLSRIKDGLLLSKEMAQRSNRENEIS